MNIIDKISKHFSSTDQLIDATTGKFNKLSKSQISELLDLKNRSIEKAHNNLPKPNSKLKDEIASDIDETMTFVLTEAKDFIRTKIDNLNQTTRAQLDEIKDIDHSKSKIRQKGEEILANMYTSVKDQFNTIYDAKENLITSKQHLKDFKIDNGIQRNPRLPESKTLSLGVLSFMFLIELFVNAFTLRDVHPDGLQGALIEIFMFSSINIFIGFSIGFLFIRWIYRVEFYKKVLGVIFTSLLFITGILFNLGIGHYRDNLLKTVILDYRERLEKVNTIGTDVISDLFTNPMMFGDMKCYLITIAGMLFFFYASKKGVDWDDPYPEYGEYAREEKERLEDYTYYMNASQNELQQISKNGISEVTGWLANNRSSIKAISERNEDIETLKESFSDFVERVQKLGEALYSQYREINLENRSDDLTPDTFEKHQFQLNSSIVQLTNIKFSHDSELRNIDNLKNDAEKYQEKIEDALNEYLRVFKLIENVEDLDTSTKYFNQLDEIHKKFS